MNTCAREERIQQWFAMWLKKESGGIEEIFSPDAVYTESWGPSYTGLDAIRHWFTEWNTRGTVQVWDIRQFFHRDDQTVVEWYFKDAMNDGHADCFEGLSLISWSTDGRICALKEFGCNTDRYDPYQNGPQPQFRDTPALWF